MKILIAAKTKEICAALCELLSDGENETVTCTSGTAARALDAAGFDNIIISTPMPDEFGLDLAADLSKDAKCAVIVLAKSEIADEVQKRIAFTGAYVLSRPFGKAVLLQTMKIAEVARRNIERLKAENERLNMQLSDIKLINRAKLTLMQYLSLSEEQAHRHIQKQAMDLRKTQRAVAEDILRTYQKNSDI